MVESRIDIAELGPEKFGLTITYDGQRFGCGSYLNRGAAQQAARLFIARKEGETAGRKKSPRRK